MDGDFIKTIVRKYRPKGWRVRESKRRSKSQSGLAVWKTKTLLVPVLEDGPSLFVFLHECGHVRLGHGTVPRPRHQEEYEAEKFAIHAMKVEGLSISPGVLNHAKINVWNRIAEDEAKGIKISKHILRWAKTCHEATI